MKLKTEFLCDQCNKPVSIDEGYEIWIEGDELVQQFCSVVVDSYNQKIYTCSKTAEEASAKILSF